MYRALVAAERRRFSDCGPVLAIFSCSARRSGRFSQDCGRGSRVSTGCSPCACRAGFLAGFEQGRLKRHARQLIAENMPAVIAPIQHVITRAGKFEPELARHPARLAALPINNIKS